MSYCNDNVVEWRPLRVADDDKVARCGHAAFADQNGDIVLVGGKERVVIGKDPKAAAGATGEFGTAKLVDLTSEEMVKQKPRFAFASVYCSQEKVFFMHGGFDSQYNHSGTRFLLTSSSPSLLELQSQCGPSPRGYHSAVYVQRNKIAATNYVYTFGGQCCQGGPYAFFNDIHRLDLQTLEWTTLSSCTGDAPSPRSQSLCFEYSNSLFVFGGYDGRSILTDLHRLCLVTHNWQRVKTTGKAPPTGLKGLFPLDFTIYFCQPSGVIIGKRLVVLTENYGNGTAALHSLNLNTMEWTRLTGRAGPRLEAEFDPPARGNPTLTLAKGGRLYLVGGHVRNPADSRDGDGGGRIWTVSLPRPMSWERERLLWLACYKNDRSECNLAKCPPHVIYHIIGYVNSNTFFIK